MAHADLYPVFLRLEGRPVTVAGAGDVALRKVKTLLASGARIRVVGPAVHHELRALAGEGRVELRERPFEPVDLDGARLAFAATDDREANEAVAAAARARAIPVNVADLPEGCDFFVPSPLRRGDLAVAVTTGGRCPAAAMRARRAVEAALDESWARFVDDVARVREELRAAFPDDPRKRRDLIRAIVNSPALDHLAGGDMDAYDRELTAWKS